MKPPVPYNEVERLRKLLEYKILDTEAETGFDDLTQLASSIFGVPVSAISLIDRDRQWFKSKVGLDVTETPRDISFCGHAILDTKVMVVTDAQEDERFRDNPLVTGEFGARFYAGAPLISDDGFNLGTLCVLDTKPHEPTLDQLTALQSLARHVVFLLELKRQHRELHQTQVQLAEQQVRMLETARKAALGDMASGVAHEINNPLAIIEGRVHQLRETLEQPDFDRARALNYCDRLVHTTKRIANIVKGLRAYSGESEELPQEIWLTTLITDTLTFCEARFRNRGIAIRVKGQAVELSLVGRPVELSQLLLNLLNNSFEAIDGSQPSTAVRPGLAVGWVEVEFEQKENTIEIHVTDSGPGITAQNRDLMFQPFFTTKPPGRAVGMGLSIARTIAEAHGGKLVFNPSSRQTRFTLTLPRADSAHVALPRRAAR